MTYPSPHSDLPTAYRDQLVGRDAPCLSSHLWLMKYPLDIYERSHRDPWKGMGTYGRGSAPLRLFGKQIWCDRCRRVVS